MIKKILLILILLSPLLFANLTKKEILAHYMYQFGIHISSSNKKPTYNIHIVDGDYALKNIFKKALRKQKINNKSIIISQSPSSTIPNNIDLVYIGEKKNSYYEKIYKQIDGKKIFIVSHSYSNKKQVMINLISKINSKLSFEINRANLLNQGLKINDKLVLLGGTELDVAKLFKGTKKTLHEKELLLKESKKLALKLKQQNRTQSLKLKNIQNEIKKSKAHADVLMKEIKSSNQKLKTTQDSLKNTTTSLKESKSSLKNAKSLLKKEKQIYLEQKKLMDKQKIEKEALEEKLIILHKTNKEGQENLNKMVKEIEEKKVNINLREKRLKILNSKILKKERSLENLVIKFKEQSFQIKSQEKVINKQDYFLNIYEVATFVFIVLILIIYFSFRKQLKVSRELKETVKKLSETQSELVESEKMASLGRLVAGVAHELNTPIGNSMTGASIVNDSTTDLMKKFNEKTMTSSEFKEYMDFMLEVSQTLELSLKKAAELVKSFKQVSVDQQTEDKRVFSFKDYLNIIVVGYKSQLKSASVTVNLEMDENISIDSYPGVYYQIFSNLINNSLSHAFKNKDGGNIFITATLDNNILSIIFKDDGVGVSEENIKSIFDPFYTTNRAHGGTGLGLHIVYNLVKQKLNGTIKAENKEGEGLVIKMILELS